MLCLVKNASEEKKPAKKQYIRPVLTLVWEVPLEKEVSILISINIDMIVKSVKNWVKSYVMCATPDW